MLDGAALQSVWLDVPERPAPRPALTADTEVDLVVVGGGFVGLWTALRAVERDPGRSVLVLEADRLAEQATGRNGGFCEASLTHGEANGRTRWPAEYDQLDRLGRENLAAMAETVARYGIDCGWAATGTLAVATRQHEVAGFDPDTEGFLDATAVRALVDSPTYLAGRWDREGSVLVDPARLAWGLAAAAESLGVRIAEHTPAQRIDTRGTGVRVTTPGAGVRARQLVLATNAFRPLLRRLRLHTVPVYDYVLATEPLTAAQLGAIGWADRQGIADAGNQFHYYRLTPDDRLLFGGYDAVYHFGRRIDPALEDRRATHRVLVEHVHDTFPQLRGIGITHRWGGVIDTSTRFTALFGTARRGRVGYALGFTGLGVGASRFAADVVLDLLAGRPTERTGLGMVRRRPVPFPPEPVAWIGIQLTRWALAREDRTGRRHPWLRLLDRLGLGFDS
ncbi:FAD-dependent oxidoreductase [Geodermatophilaceae bacterium NBWT11]|nr:FAD-dependent oxidoreductase [Geodermatophilaceae bacterium NBWT11]